MEPVISSAKGPLITHFTRSLIAVAMLALLLTSAGRAQPTLGPNIFPQTAFEDPNPTYVPWAGVDAAGDLRGIAGSQLAVGESGKLASYNFGPSVAAGDLRGKGVQDLVLADSHGYFWYYPNSGTAKQPVFTQGEVMPIWLSDERLDEHSEDVSNAVPRVQLVDFDGSKKLDILAGTYSGKLFRIPNVGSASSPLFKPTLQRDQLLISTHKGGVLWNNYMAPFLTTAFSRSNLLDLVAGEGTYSANSIYLLRNTNSNAHPEYNEDRMTKIIAGMGKEQLTPVVLDWNGDGKPDILSGERTGFFTLYLNTSSDPDNPTFDAGTHVRIGGLEKLGNSVTVSLADLTGNGLPNLLIGRDDGTVLYAINNGKPGAPDFSKPATPLKGVLPPSYHYISSRNWYKDQAYGTPYELVSYVNPQAQPGFSFPAGVTSHYALKFSLFPYQNTFFPQRYYPVKEDEWRQHMITCSTSFTLKMNTTYQIHFWVKSEGTLGSPQYRFKARSSHRELFNPYTVTNSFHVTNEWTEVNDEIRIDNPDDKTLLSWLYTLQFRFTGQTTFYVADLRIQEETSK